MNLETLTWIVVGSTFALYIGIAIWARAGSTGEFYVAGKGINPVLNGMATAADLFERAAGQDATYCFPNRLGKQYVASCPAARSNRSAAVAMPLRTGLMPLPAT